MTSNRHHGGCLCGAITYELRGDIGAFGYCHCRSCRKASGSAFGANAPIARSALRLRDPESVLREYESSSGKFRVFCSRCGSPIYAYLRDTPDTLRLRLGSLDSDLPDRVRAHLFVADKASWEEIGDDAPRFDAWPPSSVLAVRGSRQTES